MDMEVETALYARSVSKKRKRRENLYAQHEKLLPEMGRHRTRPDAPTTEPATQFPDTAPPKP
jgi:hypothetical protein